jgi:polysaccharide biosynthesis/export protein
VRAQTRWTGMPVIAALAALCSVAGCSKEMANWWKTDAFRFLAPEQVVRPPEGSPINPILGSIGPTDRSEDIVPNATMPRDGDWTYSDKDYIIGPTDILDISILDLFADGLETVLRRQVTNTGFIDLPLLKDRVKAEGLTKDQLRDVVSAAYTPNVLKNPTVSITVAAERQNTFSVLGAVSRPGTYNILRKDMRLLEALALAGGISQTNIDYLYVIRPEPTLRVREAVEKTKLPGALEGLPALPEEVTSRPAATRPTTQGAADTEKALKELGEAMRPGPAATTPASQPKTRPTSPAVMRFSETAGTGAASAPASQPDRSTWRYSPTEGWVRVGPAQTQPAGPVAEAPTTRPLEAGDPFGWKKAVRSDMARVIAINIKQLREGDPRMNVVIRDNDVVHVPSLEVGEFYVSGEVQRPGVYSLTGRRITVKMAVAAAGNMTPLAWPDNCLLIRRIGNNQEQVIPLDLEAIFRGDDPDIYLKANDMIAVGSDVRTAFFAVLRNAFRLTYGFGFIYDRNFSEDPEYPVTSKRFKRW